MKVVDGRRESKCGSSAFTRRDRVDSCALNLDPPIAYRRLRRKKKVEYRVYVSYRIVSGSIWESIVRSFARARGRSWGMGGCASLCFTLLRLCPLLCVCPNIRWIHITTIALRFCGTHPIDGRGLRGIDPLDGFRSLG